jgi:hypothetical protein
MKRESLALLTILVVLMAAGVLYSAPAARAADTQVTIVLKDHSGNPLDTGTVYYAGGSWQLAGTTTSGSVTISLAPGSYSFRMYYGDAMSEQSGVAVSGDSTTVTFKTTLVTVELKNHSNAPEVGNGLTEPPPELVTCIYKLICSTGERR